MLRVIITPDLPVTKVCVSVGSGLLYSHVDGTGLLYSECSLRFSGLQRLSIQQPSGKFASTAASSSETEFASYSSCHRSSPATIQPHCKPPLHLPTTILIRPFFIAARWPDFLVKYSQPLHLSYFLHLFLFLVCRPAIAGSSEGCGIGETRVRTTFINNVLFILWIRSTVDHLNHCELGYAWCMLGTAIRKTKMKS